VQRPSILGRRTRSAASAITPSVTQAIPEEMNPDMMILTTVIQGPANRYRASQEPKAIVKALAGVVTIPACRAVAVAVVADEQREDMAISSSKVRHSAGHAAVTTSNTGSSGAGGHAGVKWGPNNRGRLTFLGQTDRR
jgi:hypothetical protein